MLKYIVKDFFNNDRLVRSFLTRFSAAWNLTLPISSQEVMCNAMTSQHTFFCTDYKPDTHSRTMHFYHQIITITTTTNNHLLVWKKKAYRQTWQKKTAKLSKNTFVRVKKIRNTHKKRLSACFYYDWWSINSWFGECTSYDIYTVHQTRHPRIYHVKSFKGSEILRQRW